jgi:hypothetical protein
LANGNIEAGVRDLNIQMRKQKIGLQKRLKQSLSAKHPVVEWLLQHSAFVYNRFVVHADGKTCYERMHGRRWRGKLVEFGEQVKAKMTKPKPQSKMPRKSGPKFVSATWLGINERTGEHIVASRTGRVFRVRTIKRRPEQVRWQAEHVMAIKATPRAPDPNKAPTADAIEVEPVDLNVELGGAQHGEDEAQAIDGDEDVRTMRHPDEVRELRLTKRMFQRYGYSDNCIGCTAHRNGAAKRGHTAVCRERMYRIMEADPEDRETLTKAIMRQMEFQEKHPTGAEGAGEASSSNPAQAAAPHEAVVDDMPLPPQEAETQEAEVDKMPEE